MATVCPTCETVLFSSTASLVAGSLDTKDAVHENTCLNGHISYHDSKTDTQYEALDTVPER